MMDHDEPVGEMPPLGMGSQGNEDFATVPFVTWGEPVYKPIEIDPLTSICSGCATKLIAGYDEAPNGTRLGDGSYWCPRGDYAWEPDNGA